MATTRPSPPSAACNGPSGVTGRSVDYGSVDQVGLAQERRQGRVDRVGVEVAGGPTWATRPPAQHRHLVGQGQRLLLVVGDQYHRGGGPRRTGRFVADTRPQGCVQGRKRLVQQHHRGIQGQGSGQGDTLLLTAGQLVREAPQVPSPTSSSSWPTRPASLGGAGRIRRCRHGQMGKERAS